MRSSGSSATTTCFMDIGASISTSMKKALNVKCGVTGRRFHDLRRTARTLMSRAKFERGIAERVYGGADVGKMKN